jgi:hypothetical protein
VAWPLLRGATGSRPCCRAAAAGGIARGVHGRGWRCPLHRGGGSTLWARALSVEAGDCCAPTAPHSTAARGGGGEAEKELEALRRSVAALQAENVSLRAQHARMEGASTAAAPQGSFSHGSAGGWVAGRGQQRQDGCNVLSLDGGGVRGLFTAVILARLVEEEPRLMERFDLVAGTSSGGIIGSKSPASPAPPGSTEDSSPAAIGGAIVRACTRTLFRIYSALVALWLAPQLCWRWGTSPRRSWTYSRKLRRRFSGIAAGCHTQRGARVVSGSMCHSD